MANPSTADATSNDPTVRKCIGFTGRNGFGRLTIVNRYAFRATDPKQLAEAAVLQGVDVRGPHNTGHVIEAWRESDAAIIAWGACLPDPAGECDLLDTLLLFSDGKPIYCLGVTKAGHPRHPLTLGYTTPLQRVDRLCLKQIVPNS
jgi:hypothetical protein